MLWTYALKYFAEKLNELKVDDDGITSMGEVLGTTKDITLKNHHTWGCTVYVMDERFQVDIYGLPK